MGVVATSELYGTDFWDMDAELLYTASEYYKNRAGEPYPFVINTSVKVGSGDIEYRPRLGREVVLKRPTISMQLILFSDEQSKQEYLDLCVQVEKGRYNRN